MLGTTTEGFNKIYMDDALEATVLYAHGTLKKAGGILPLLKHEDYTMPSLTSPARLKKELFR